MIASLLVSVALAATPCDSQTAVAPEYKDVQKQIDDKLATAGNLATIAEEADGVLSKLIAAKSPILMTWLKDRQLMSADEIEIAKAWRLYYLHKFVLDRYPTDNAAINRSVNALFSQAHDIALDQNLKTRLAGVLEAVKKDAKRLVLTWEVPKKDKQSIIHRIDTVQLAWFSSLETSPFKSNPMSFLSHGLDYNANKHQIFVGVKTRSLASDANFYTALAHELSHAFDPCHWGLFIKGPSPFSHLENCLRNPQGAAAKKRDDGSLIKALKGQMISKEMAQSLQQNPTCNTDQYPPQELQKDQLNEAFADWFAAEVFATSSYNKHFPRPDLCRDQKPDLHGEQLANDLRLQRIYLAHPAIAKVWSPDSPTVYCSLTEKKAE